jgi:hypothetical protein
MRLSTSLFILYLFIRLSNLCEDMQTNTFLAAEYSILVG